MNRSRNPFRQLNFRIIAPVALLVAVIGFGLNVFMLRSFNRFERASIADDVQWTASFVYDQIDDSFYNLLKSGGMDNPGLVRIAKGHALGALDDFMRQKEFAAAVLSEDDGTLLLGGGFAAETVRSFEADIPENRVWDLSVGGKEYVIYRFSFEPWRWQIFILKDKTSYGLLAQDLKFSYKAMVVVLILAAVLLYVSLRVNIDRPVHAIIGSLSRGDQPSYRGTAEFEYLSRSIGDMMDALAERERKARESESRYRLLADNATDVIWTLDLDLRYTYISPSVHRFRGYTTAEILREGLEKSITPDSVGVIRQAFGEEMERERLGGADPDRTRILELQYTHRDGHTVWGEVAARFLRDESGRPVGILGVTRDITKRREAETALKESEELFRTAFRTSPDSVNINRLSDGLYVDVNEGFSRIAGYSRDEVVGKTSSDIRIWEDPSDRGRLLEGLKASGEVTNFRARFRMKDGTFRVGLMSARVIDIGGVPHILNITRDITDLELAQQAVVESEERFRTAFLMSPDAISITDLASGRFYDVNEGFAALTGVPRQEARGKTAIELGIMEHPEERESIVEVVREKGSVTNVEMNLRSRNGQRCTVLFSARRFKAGGTDYMLAMARDITSMKHAEVQLRSSLEEKEVLLKEIHHRVKNNLQVISGLLNLQSHHITDSVGREIYKESQNRIITMALIHEQLYQSGDLAHINFGAYIQQLVRNLIVSYGIDRNRVDIVLDVKDVTLVVDTAIPCGVIVNELVSNSLRHAFKGRAGGRLTVRFGEASQRNYELEISDDGVGLPADFDLKGSKSMGLKLVLVLVEQLGGSLTISREGGTRFNITFREYLEAGTEMH